MLISYHIKAELCTLFDKVHKAFINSANAPHLCTLYRLPTVCLSADTAAQPVEARLALPGRGMFAMTWRGIAAARRRGDCRGLPAETKGARTPNGFLAPLDAPNLPFALTHRRCAAKRGTRGLGSGRRGDCGTHGRPEFTLRDLQRCQCAAIRCRAIAPPRRKNSAGVLLCCCEYEKGLPQAVPFFA